MYRVWQLDPAQLTPYYNLAVCQALTDIGCDVRYITSKYLYSELKYPQTFTIDHVYFRHLDSVWLRNHGAIRQILRGIAYPLGHLQVVREAATNPPDVLHMQWARLPILDFQLIRQLQHRRIPVILTIHDVEPLFEISRDGLRRVYEQADALIIHSEIGLSTFRKLHPTVDITRIHHLPILTHANAHIPDSGSMREARRILGLPPDVPVVLFFGVIKPYKGLDILLKAFEQVRDARSDIILLIAGNPSDRSMQALVETAKQQPNCRVVSEFIPEEETWLYHLAADLVVFPYRTITQSGALLTAMEYGCPVIVTDVGGLPETVNGNGWAIPSGDVDALVSTMIKALGDRSELLRRGQRSVELIQTRHHPKVFAQKLCDIYRSVVR